MSIETQISCGEVLTLCLRNIGRDFEHQWKAKNPYRPSVSEFLKDRKWAKTCKLFNFSNSLFAYPPLRMVENDGHVMLIPCDSPFSKRRIETESLCGVIIVEDENNLIVRYEDPSFPCWWCEIVVVKSNLKLSQLNGLFQPFSKIFCEHVSKNTDGSTTLQFRRTDELPNYESDFFNVHFVFRI